MKQLFKILLPVCLAMAACGAAAQPYPNRPVKIIIPFPPGGTLDIVGRLLALKPGRQTGQQFVVDHRAGGSGIIGLGLAGTAIAQRLRGAGFTCVGYDIDAMTCTRFAAAGGRLAASARDVGQKASQLITAVFNTQDVLKVIEGPNGALEGGTPQVVINCSSGDGELDNAAIIQQLRRETR